MLKERRVATLTAVKTDPTGQEGASYTILKRTFKRGL